MLESYATKAEYEAKYGQDAKAEEKIFAASRHIDTLTFNRIGTIDALTPFQKAIVKHVCIDLTHFESENADMIESLLSSYTVNGVSMGFQTGPGVAVIGGIAIPRQLYSMLMQTGLCCRRC